MEHVLMNGQLSTFGGFQEIGSIGSIKFLAASRERRAAEPSQQSPCSNRRSQSRLAQVAVGSNFQHFCHDQRFVMIDHYYYPSNAMQFTSCLDLRGNIATKQCNDGTIILFNFFAICNFKTCVWYYMRSYDMT